MLIGFIRHGLTDWNAIGKIQGQTDIPLNEEGRLQARLLGERLLQEPYKWDFIVSSGLSRAEETGSIIASMLDIPMLEPDLRLRERAYGQVEGLTASEREIRFGKEWKHQDLGQETDLDLQARGMEFLEEMWNKYPKSNMLVVSHGGFLAQLYGTLYKDRIVERIGNLSITILEKKDVDWVPLLFNCTRHLLEKQH
ncbi:histidine phosphatase family protein [Paenibacillus sp. N3/727]|uniref:histidine phosphatase family protein n=1 Tax=Paenibacillus sp. N3/727 TaxID=2925845 RepID=UPI001F534592|nr:histidine phosphatase family protein [Paenibacillus sp. N3/727]UNK20533.1 histidine phosphatase family protein [Paenibacillus sp. N3/727]